MEKTDQSLRNINIFEKNQFLIFFLLKNIKNIKNIIFKK